MKRTCHIPLLRTLLVLAALMLGAILMSCTSDATEDTPASSSSAEHQAQASSQQQPQNVACIGDSITYGYGLSSPAKQAWPALLEDKLGEGSRVANLGESGTTLMDEGEYPYRSTGYLEEAKQMQPDVFIVMLGTNDAFSYRWNSESYRTQLGALVDELAASTPQARIVLMAPPRTFYEYAGYGTEGTDDVVIGGQIRSIVRETAGEKGCDYVDLYAFTEQHPEWFPDCLHPNTQGHAALADYLCKELFA